MKRRTLFGKLAAAAAVVAVAPAIEVQAAEAPFTYSEALTARELLVEQHERGLATLDEVRGAFAVWPDVREGMRRDCASRGCRFEAQFSIEWVAFEMEHWQEGATKRDGKLRIERIEERWQLIDYWRQRFHGVPFDAEKDAELQRVALRDDPMVEAPPLTARARQRMAIAARIEAMAMEDEGFVPPPELTVVWHGRVSEDAFPPFTVEDYEG